MKKTIRIVHPLVAQPVGGVGTFLKNTFETTEGYDVTIIESSRTMEGGFNSYFSEREVPIHLFPSVTKPLAYFHACKDFYKNHAMDFDFVHVHSPANALPHLYYAKKYGIKHRIYHSHSTRYSDTLLKSIRNWLLLKFALPMVTDFFACGQLAGKNILKKRSFTIIPNSIDVEKFRFDKAVRQRKRQEYQLDNGIIVIGCVGTMDDNKNQKLLIEMMHHLPKGKYALVLIGTGVNESSLKEQAQSFDNIHFLGRKENIADYYSMMDIVALPSHFEGFPMIAVEAQANGLPLIVSNTLDTTVDITGRVTFSPISDTLEWVKTIQQISVSTTQERIEMNEQVKKKGYESSSARAFLHEKYMQILGKTR